MTTRTDSAQPPGRAGAGRRSHVPGDGSAHAAAVERAQKGMLHEARDLKRTRIGADVLCEAPPPPGRRRLLQLPGRRDPAALRRPWRLPGAAPRPRPPRAGRGPRGGRLRPCHRHGRRVHGHLRPRRHEPRHGHRDGDARLGADGRHHRQRALRPDRQGCVPGDRHQRHHAADDEAQLPRPRCRRAAARRRRGVPHRAQWPTRPGPHRHHQGRAPAGDPRRAPDPRRGRRRAAGVPAQPRRPRPPAQDGRHGDRERQAPGHPGRPRRPARRGVGRPEGVRREDLDPGGLDAARHRGDGRDAPARLRLHGHARLEARQPCDPERRPAHRHRDALRRPRDRQRPDLRAVCPDHPRRHRPGRDRQERRGRGADRRRCRARPSRADPDGPRDHRPTSGASTSTSWPTGSATRRRRRGTARAPGATGCCPPTTSSSASAS